MGPAEDSAIESRAAPGGVVLFVADKIRFYEGGTAWDELHQGVSVATWEWDPSPGDIPGVYWRWPRTKVKGFTGVPTGLVIEETLSLASDNIQAAYRAYVAGLAVK